MRRIESIIKVSDQGVSRPFLCRDENGCVRWCKGSHTGFRSLISEWLCACLAREIGLPIPDFEVFRLDRSDFCAWRAAQNSDAPGLVTDANQFVFERAWNEMPDAWTDVGETALPLDSIRRVILEGCDG